MYLTLDELKARAAKKDVDISSYTDDELTDFLNECQKFIEEQTGRIFEVKTLTEKYFRVTGSRIMLQHPPVLIDETHPFSIKIDGSDQEGVDVDQQYGIVLLDVPQYRVGPYNQNNAVITYTTCPDFQDPSVTVHPTAKRLLSDMVFFELQKPSDGQKVSSFKDADFSVNFDNVDWIAQRIKDLRRPLLSIM